MLNNINMLSNMNKFSIILGIVPFVIIIFAGFLLGCFNPKSHIYQLLSGLSETDLHQWMEKAGFEKTTQFAFQSLRILVSITLGILISYVIYFNDRKMFIICSIIGALLIYKGLYYYLRVLAKQRINKLNQLIPYMMKNIIYLCHIYPLNNALLISINYVPEEFKADMSTLVREIDTTQGSTYEPYKHFIDRYEGQLDGLDMYFSMLYRMGQSVRSNDENLLDSLNKMIDDDVARVRLDKNEQINKTVALIGNIPVLLLTAMLVYVMILMTSAL